MPKFKHKVQKEVCTRLKFCSYPGQKVDLKSFFEDVKSLDFPEEESWKGSDVFDPFDKYHSEYIKKIFAKRKTNIPKWLVNQMLMDSYTNDFKEAMADTRLDLGTVSLTAEDLEEVRERIHLVKPIVKSSNEASQVTRSSSAIDLTEALTRGNAEKDELVFDSLSGMWRMLASTDKYRITQPGYNAHLQLLPHWLDVPDPVPWAKINESRLKCEEWLQKYF